MPASMPARALYPPFLPRPPAWGLPGAGAHRGGGGGEFFFFFFLPGWGKEAGGRELAARGSWEQSLAWAGEGACGTAWLWGLGYRRVGLTPAPTDEVYEPPVRVSLRVWTYAPSHV